MQTSTQFPKSIFGTSCLGNLFKETPFEVKKKIVSEVIQANPHGAVFDSAGKYGAGLSLEVLGQCLEELKVNPEDVTIINKLAWKRVPLTTPEPTFEPDAWVGIEHDAIQQISYDGILECYEQGNQLLGSYLAKVVSVHDPDEFLAAAENEEDLKQRQNDLLGAFRALNELKIAGKVDSVGVGAKDISAIDFISDHIQLDWAMFACSITLFRHKAFARNLLKKLAKQEVSVINSAVFHSGFLLGGEFFDYKKISLETHPEIFFRREIFWVTCREFNVSPAAACVQFSFLFPEICSVALSTTKPEQVRSNIELLNDEVPLAFWYKLQERGLINADL
ncbi:MAG: aldo/keto reductase [Lentisphaerales bacterium]|nr:aldo/keto reductase [Lentisphaerales bacterium]